MFSSCPKPAHHMQPEEPLAHPPHSAHVLRPHTLLMSHVNCNHTMLPDTPGLLTTIHDYLPSGKSLMHAPMLHCHMFPVPFGISHFPRSPAYNLCRTTSIPCLAHAPRHIEDLTTSALPTPHAWTGPCPTTSLVHYRRSPLAPLQASLGCPCRRWAQPRYMDVIHLHDHVPFVDQNQTLFDMSITNNITNGHYTLPYILALSLVFGSLTDRELQYVSYYLKHLIFYILINIKCLKSLLPSDILEHIMVNIRI